MEKDGLVRISITVLLTCVWFRAVGASRTTSSPTLEEAIANYRSGPRYLNSWAVEVRGGKNVADDLARKHGFMNRGQIGNLKDHYYFVLGEQSGEVTEELASLMHMKTTAMMQELTVNYVEQQKIRRREKKAYSPPSDPGWSRQWSLLNTGQTNGPSELDLNVEPAWIQDFTGKGVVVAFIDDGLYWKHSDLRHNYDADASYDFAHNDRFPNPDPSSGEPNSHGTNCAGEVGMARNSICGVGVAYECHIGGLKVDLETLSDAVEASAIGFQNNHIHVYSNSWGPSDYYGFIVDGPGRLARAAILTGVTEGRNGKGNIYVWAAGNGGDYYDSCAADGYVASIYTIAIGSADQNAQQADYDEDCSAKMAVTFSYNSDTFPSYNDNWDIHDQIYTTTLENQCTDDFTGTSASAPLASGSIALALQANSNLTWRDAQYLIAYTSNSDVLTGDDWVTNGGGLRVSHHFGFGAIDVEAMVTRARHWVTVPEQHSITIQGSSSARNIYSRRSITFSVTESSFTNESHITFLEHVIITMSLSLKNYGTGYTYDDFYTEYYHDYDAGDFDALYDWLADSHPRRGDIKIELTSPQGTTSVLLPYRDYDFINTEGYDSWPFMSVHFWGENPIGTWTLKITYRASGYVHMSGLSMTLYGTESTPEAVSSIPSHCHSSCVRSCSAEGPENCDACTNLRVASTLECVDECPPGTDLYKSYCVCSSEAGCSSVTISPSLSSSTLVNFLSTSAAYEPANTSTVLLQTSKATTLPNASSRSSQPLIQQTNAPSITIPQTNTSPSLPEVITSSPSLGKNTPSTLHSIFLSTTEFIVTPVTTMDTKSDLLSESQTRTPHSVSPTFKHISLHVMTTPMVLYTNSPSTTEDKVTSMSTPSMSAMTSDEGSKIVNSSQAVRAAVGSTTAVLLSVTVVVVVVVVAIFLRRRLKRVRFSRLKKEDDDHIILVET